MMHCNILGGELFASDNRIVIDGNSGKHIFKFKDYEVRFVFVKYIQICIINKCSGVCKCILKNFF